jgi:hypothetical protein
MSISGEMHKDACKAVHQFIEEEILPNSLGYISPIHVLMSVAKQYLIASCPERDGEAEWIVELQAYLDDAKEMKRK